MPDSAVILAAADELNVAQAAYDAAVQARADAQAALNAADAAVPVAQAALLEKQAALNDAATAP